MEMADFNQQLAAAAREMVEESGMGDTLDRAVRMTTEILASCDLAGLSVVRGDGTIDTPAASSEDLRTIDQLQYELHEGPCYDALHQDDVVTANDLAHDKRWSRWGPRIAQEVGVRSSMSFRLFTTGGNIGALNVYARTQHAFTTHDLYEGQAIAAQAAVALAGALRESQLVEALQSRTTIGQATGIIMERFNLSADSAFGVLRRVSSQTNTKLHRLAVTIVETRSLPGSGG